MPRPRKCRRICTVPEAEGFFPIGADLGPEVILAVDEYEAIRLIDFEKFTQEQCAKQMNVSRTTITNIYENARYKLADALIHRKKLSISGGDVQICPFHKECCGQGCHKGCFQDEMTCKKKECKRRI